MPDGQGQFSQFDLGSADRIEVLRGPFSALYGNSSGGVIAIFTEDATPGYWVDGTAEYGTFNTQRYAVKTTGNDGVVNYVLDASHFQTDGYRYHSDAERDVFNGKLKFPVSGTSTITVVANAVEMPFVQDPLGLTQMQLDQDRRQAGVGAIAYDTRKDLDQEQLGIVWDDRLSAADEINTTWYAGHRAITQYQAIPQATEERSVLNPGGVIDLDRAYGGVDAHLSDRRSIGDTALLVVEASATTIWKRRGWDISTTSVPTWAWRARYGATRPTTSMTSINTCRRSGTPMRGGGSSPACATTRWT